MNVHMSPPEKALFSEMLSGAKNYVEFGSGGSTVEAVKTVPGFVVTVDSSTQWLSNVKTACEGARHAASLTLVHVDIGPTGEWGSPVGDGARQRWPLYALAPWDRTPAIKADLFLVDGRFRVACVLETLMRCDDAATVLIHDFGNRPKYHVVREFADETRAVGNLSVLRRRKTFDFKSAIMLLDRYRYVYE